MCKRWAIMLARPDAAWAAVELRVERHRDIFKVACWVARRAPAMRSLSLLTEATEDPDGSMNAAMAVVCTAVGPHLLRLEGGCWWSWLLPHTVRYLSLLENLRVFHVPSLHPSVEAHHFNVLSSLVSLEELALGLNATSVGAFPEGLLALSALKVLHVEANPSQLEAPGGFGMLPESCAASWPLLEHLRLFDVGVSGLPGSNWTLQSLCAGPVHMQDVPRVVANLDAARALALNVTLTAGVNEVSFAHLSCLTILTLDVTTDTPTSSSLHMLEGAIAPTGALTRFSLQHEDNRLGFDFARNGRLLRFAPLPAAVSNLISLDLGCGVVEGIPPVLCHASRLQKLGLALATTVAVDNDDVGTLVEMRSLQKFCVKRATVHNGVCAMVNWEAGACFNKLVELPGKFVGRHPGMTTPQVVFCNPEDLWNL